MVVLDVWGGERSQDYVARYMLPEDEALERARRELRAGYLVNLRNEVAWGTEQDFDLRAMN
jgi:hypothetical protein